MIYVLLSLVFSGVLLYIEGQHVVVGNAVAAVVVVDGHDYVVMT